MALFDAAQTASMQVARLVLHEIGPNAGDFKLFNGTVDPGEMQEFFLARLQTANNGSAYSFAAESVLAASLRTVRQDENELEAAGKAIATRFNELHRGNVNPGTLAIFELTSPARALYAVVKFDSQGVVAVDEDTHAHARLSLLRKTIVESKDAMQMSAVIRLSDDGGELAVRARSRIANYFITFLGAERSFTEMELTSNLSAVLKATATEQREHINPQVFSDLPTRIYQAVQNFETFDPETDTMLAAVFGPLPADSPVRAAFARQLAARDMEHEEFDLVRTAVKAPTKRRITTVENIQVTYGLQYAGNVHTEIDERTGHVVRVVIDTAGVEADEQLP